MNRREALQTGLGIIAASGIDGEVATLTVRNPMAFVITTPKRISEDTRRRIREEWESVFLGTQFGGIPVLILQDGMQLSVVDKE